MLSDSEVCATIAVKDMTVAAKFYEETLGLKKTKETPAGNFYAAGKGTGVFVYPSPNVAGSNQATYVAWSVEDVDTVVADLKAKGVTFEQYDGIPHMTREGDIHIMGDSRSAWFKDPDGNILNIVTGM